MLLVAHQLELLTTSFEVLCFLSDEKHNEVKNRKLFLSFCCIIVAVHPLHQVHG